MIKGINEDDVILLMFSGGLDSTYLLYHLLKETKNPIHVHHISFRVKPEPRWEAEDDACRKIVEYCKKNYRDFDYSESKYEFMDFDKYLGKDTDIQLAIAVRVAPNIAIDINKKVIITIGACFEDIKEQKKRNEINNKILKALLDGIDNKNIKNKIYNDIYFPLIEDLKYSKIDMIKNMPYKLYKMTWSCRKPIKDKNGNFNKCGRCHSCKDNINAVKELKLKVMRLKDGKRNSKS